MGRRRSTEKTDGPTPVKVLLQPVEHTVVSTAASMKNLTISEYIRQATLEKAKSDAEGFFDLLKALKSDS